MTNDRTIDNLISNIDAEMQRLGWTTELGREHLIKYYGVRSRLQLTEDELDNFLLYLQLTDTSASLRDATRTLSTSSPTPDNQ